MLKLHNSGIRLETLLVKNQFKNIYFLKCVFYNEIEINAQFTYENSFAQKRAFKARGIFKINNTGKFGKSFNNNPING